MKPSRRWLLGSGLALTAAGSGVGWFLVRDTPDNWEVPFAFLTDDSVFYDRWQAKKRDPIFWWAALTQPELHALGWSGDGAPWQMVIEGDGVGTATTLDLVGLRAIADADGTIALLKTMRCSGDSWESRLASNGVWTGVPLAPLLAKARVTPDAKRLRITGHDGFTANVGLDMLRTEDGRQALLALDLNGKPLSHERGGPVRLIVPDRFGFKNVKWPKRLEVTTSDAPWGNHEVDTNAGTDSGEITLGSKILRPDIKRTNPDADAPLAPLVLAGVAFGGTEPVARVEVQVGRDAPWKKARLPRPKELTGHAEVARAWTSVGKSWPLPDVWTPWTLHWTPKTPGDYRIRVRATSASGRSQPDDDGDWRDANSAVARGTVRVS